MQELSGKWQGATDGMTYVMTQQGNILFVRGEGLGSQNVGYGIINPQEQSIVFHWADMPGSAGYGNHGICYLDARNPGQISKRAGCPQFGIGNFRKIS